MSITKALEVPFRNTTSAVRDADLRLATKAAETTASPMTPHQVVRAGPSPCLGAGPVGARPCAFRTERPQEARPCPRGFGYHSRASSPSLNEQRATHSFRSPQMKMHFPGIILAATVVGTAAQAMPDAINQPGTDTNTPNTSSETNSTARDKNGKTSSSTTRKQSKKMRSSSSNQGTTASPSAPSSYTSGNPRDSSDNSATPAAGNTSNSSSANSNTSADKSADKSSNTDKSTDKGDVGTLGEPTAIVPSTGTAGAGSRTNQVG